MRVYEVFNDLIHRYDPEVPNFNRRPFYCVTDGDHIYTLNNNLDNLTQKSEDDDYNVSVGSNFNIPDKLSEKSNLIIIIIKHTDDMLDIVREQPTVEDKEEETCP